MATIFTSFSEPFVFYKVMILASMAFGIIGKLSALHSPPLPFSVSVVVEVCPKKYVRRIAAWWIVAFVAAQQFLGEGAVRDEPRNPVGILMNSSDGVLPIPFYGFTGFPYPTLIVRSYFYLTPKSGNPFLRQCDFLTPENKGRIDVFRHIANPSFVMRLAPFGSDKLPYGAYFLPLNASEFNRKSRVWT